MRCGSGPASCCAESRPARRSRSPTAAGPSPLLSPLPQGGPYEQLLASGEIERATLDVVDLPEPLDLDAGVELPSVTLARLREHER